MPEVIKRIISSIGMIVFFYFALINKAVLFILLLAIFYQIFNEFYNILIKIFKNKKKILINLLGCILIYLLFTILISWVSLSNQNIQRNIFLLIILICISSDVGGYVFGKIFKGKKLSKISPNKTYSGLFGSYILSIFLVYFIFQKYYSFDFLFLFTILISTISQSGDLFISYIKRKAKIKDTAKIIPGHGGLLDRFDGIIFAIPFGMLLFNFL
tara:strand:+ start:120 stop:761 length:642 start_codon:yes stop_codon:yes gene_type:complete